jgi:flagellar M-ring protein FliF
MDRIAGARVHLVIPKRELFAKERKEATASIVIKTRGSLDKSHINAIQHLVAAAVDGLKTERVSIVDETGRLLAAGDGDSINGFGASSLQERTLEYQNRVRRQIETVVESIVGPGRARIQVAAELDFNRITETSDTFDPDGQVVRSSQSRSENTSSSQAKTNNAVSVGEALPGAELDAAADGNKQEAETSEEVVNYEISKTTRTEVIEAGGVKKISVAVLVDGLYQESTDGQTEYAARDPQQLEQIATLVRSAVGFDQSRGDVVEVVNLRFAAVQDAQDLGADNAGMFDFDQSDYFRMAEIGVTLMLGLMVLFFVARPLVNKVLAPADERAPSGAVAALASPEAAIQADGSAAEVDSSDPHSIEKALIAGAVQDRSLEKIGQLVEEHPDAAATIVRNWLTEAA